MIAWFAEGSTSHVKDYWSKGRFDPGEDESQDV